MKIRTNGFNNIIHLEFKWKHCKKKKKIKHLKWTYITCDGSGSTTSMNCVEADLWVTNVLICHILELVFRCDLLDVGDDLKNRSWRYSFQGTGLQMLLVTFHVPMLTVGIRKKSRVPGVMITQFFETLPEGKSHPDFTRKPIALTIQEGMCGSLKIHEY